ncbi:unnamed protein product, partial [Mesorhabditis spiculigera]
MSTPSNASPDTTILDEHEHESAHTATSGHSSETDERPKSEDVPGVQNGEDVKPESQDGEIKQETVPLTPEESVGSPQSSSSSTTRPPNDGRRENGNDEKAVIADTSSRSSDNDSAKITEGMARATLNDSGKGTSQPVGYTPPPSVSGGSGSSGNSQPQKIIKPYETVQFCRRPGYVNPAVVTPVKAYSNHFELKTPVSIDFMLYNVEVNMHDGRQWKQLIKREDVAPIFWKIVKQNSDVFLTETAQISRHHIFPTNYIFNDVNLLYVKGLKQLPGVRGHASYLYTESAGRRDFRYEMTVKLTGPQRASFAKNASLEERQNAMTLLDLVLSARVRCLLHPASWQFTTYRMSYRIQKVEQERLVNMTDQIVQRIADFITHTGKKPKHIVIYRDGVSETEFKHTFYEEQKAYNNALARLNMEGPDKPTLTYIVTSKRHHTRFFPAPGAKDLLRSGNFRPGLLIEDDVVSSEYFDFYITAQNGALGTSRPTHYYVLHDDWNPSSGFWQNITFALCHLYCRTNKSVSLPAPVYYAHLAAKRAADWVAGYEHNYFAEDKAKERGGQGEDDTYTWLKEKNSTPKVKGMVFC